MGEGGRRELRKQKSGAGGVRRGRCVYFFVYIYIFFLC